MTERWAPAPRQTGDSRPDSKSEPAERFSRVEILRRRWRVLQFFLLVGLLPFVGDDMIRAALLMVALSPRCIQWQSQQSN